MKIVNKRNASFHLGFYKFNIIGSSEIELIDRFTGESFKVSDFVPIVSYKDGSVADAGADLLKCPIDTEALVHVENLGKTVEGKDTIYLVFTKKQDSGSSDVMAAFNAIK